MANTWLGGGNNNASNPKDWSPGGAPTPGETLNIEQGTINVHQGDLSGDTLDVTDTVSSPPDVTINAYNNSVFSLETGGYVNGGKASTVDINIHGNAYVSIPLAETANLTTSGGNLVFLGGSNEFLDNQVFNSALWGNSNIVLDSANLLPEHMELGGYVAPGLNFDIDGNGPPLTSLQIDHPNEFHAVLTVNAAGSDGNGLGYVGFMGIHATAVDISGDMLQMFNGNKLVDSTLYTGATTGIGFEQTSAGVFLTTSTALGGNLVPGGSSGTVLPYHVA